MSRNLILSQISKKTLTFLERAFNTMAQLQLKNYIMTTPNKFMHNKIMTLKMTDLFICIPLVSYYMCPSEKVSCCHAVVAPCSRDHFKSNKCLFTKCIKITRQKTNNFRDS